MKLKLFSVAVSCHSLAGRSYGSASTPARMNSPLRLPPGAKCCEKTCCSRRTLVDVKNLGCNRLLAVKTWL